MAEETAVLTGDIQVNIAQGHGFGAGDKQAFKSWRHAVQPEHHHHPDDNRKDGHDRPDWAAF